MSHSASKPSSCAKFLALESIRRFQWKSEAFFYSWLSRIARNVFIDHSKEARRNRYLELPDQLPAKTSSPSRGLRREERLDRLEDAITQLPPDYRDVLRFSQLQGLKVREIAMQMKPPPRFGTCLAIWLTSQRSAKLSYSTIGSPAFWVAHSLVSFGLAEVQRVLIAAEAPRGTPCLS